MTRLTSCLPYTYVKKDMEALCLGWDLKVPHSTVELGHLNHGDESTVGERSLPSGKHHLEILAAADRV